MSGAFAVLQEVYARHGVATYPLTEGKAPAVRGYQRIGAAGSCQLVMKFPMADAFGFVAGVRNRVTVVDIDSPDDHLVEEIQGQYGATPLQVVTPSGGRHLYYRHGGEARRIRPLPNVDVLGAGNVVAAGSIVPKGRYAIERGELEDLARLPTMRLSGSLAAPGRVPEGQRNTTLFEYCRRTVSFCDGLDQLLDAAAAWADANFIVPLPAAEIRKTCSSVWNYRRGRRRIMNHLIEGPQFDALTANQSAMALFAYLSGINSREATFWIADGLAGKLGWSRRSIPEGRKTLLELGIVECVRQAGKNAPALYRWTSGGRFRPTVLGR